MNKRNNFNKTKYMSIDEIYNAMNIKLRQFDYQDINDNLYKLHRGAATGEEGLASIDGYLFDLKKNNLMRILLVVAMLLTGFVVTAQETKKQNVKADSANTLNTQEDSLIQKFLGDNRGVIPYRKIDTTGMGQYGMRIYDPRMGHYIPPPKRKIKSPRK